jgi:hypothetical protein
MAAETELSMVAIFVNGSGRNEQSQQRTFHRYFLPSFGSFDQTVSEEKNLIHPSNMAIIVTINRTLVKKFIKQLF